MQEKHYGELQPQLSIYLMWKKRGHPRKKARKTTFGESLFIKSSAKIFH
jgi:hypothetical protein